MRCQTACSARSDPSTYDLLQTLPQVGSGPSEGRTESHAHHAYAPDMLRLGNGLSGPYNDLEHDARGFRCSTTVARYGE